MKKNRGVLRYFPSNVPISRIMWERLRLGRPQPGMPEGTQVPEIVFIRRVADSLNRLPDRSSRPVAAGLINLYGLQARILRHLIDRFTADQLPGGLETAAASAGHPYASPATQATLKRFAELFPGAEVLADAMTPGEFVAGDDPRSTRKNILVRELLLLLLARENVALDPFRELLDHVELAPEASCGRLAASIDRQLDSFPTEGLRGGRSESLSSLLRAPQRAAPRSLAGQLEYMRDQWSEFLPVELLDELLTSIDILREEEQARWGGGPGKPQVLEFLARGPGSAHGDDVYHEYERFSPDADWMANVVMIAKMTYVWLDQLSRAYSMDIRRLDQVPDEELDRLARWGFTGLWLIGLWERSAASQKIKQISGNSDAISSAYSLFDYVIAADLGGEPALFELKERCARRGIRLASDMVPNHTGIYSRWTVEHPDWFIQLDYPPYPDYNFTGPDLSFSDHVSLQIEDGYWDRSNAAVVFRHQDRGTGRTRYIYHGNDGTSTPWNDTAQLNYLIPEVRETVIQTILHVARLFPIIRFDAAMTLAKKHFQRLWYPLPGHGSGVSSRAEHGMSRADFDAVFPEEFWRQVVDRVAAEVPDTLLLAEAFWLMEGYFVRTLGMHRVYNSAFMNMLKMEENAKYRQTLKNVLEYDHRILQRFVNFMNNPDERTAVEQFGKEGKYFGAALLLVTLPGLPMFGHGQIEGFHEKYGMEYKRAYWDEPVDEHLVRMHEERIFPVMRRRWLFSGSENFVLYDFYAGDHVNEDVFAFSNRVGDARGIVLFQNRYANVSGRINMSAAMAVQGGEGEASLVRKTLGEALGFNPDGRIYYTFIDAISGLEFLRSGRDFCLNGLQTELAGYECRAYLDFTEIEDDDFGTWGKLCHNLQGRGVVGIEDEIRQLRYREVIDRFLAALVSAGKLLTATEEDEHAVSKCGGTLEDLYDEINRNTLCTGDSRALTGATLAGFRSVRRLGEVSLKDPEPSVDTLLISAYLVLHGAGSLAETKDSAAVAVAWYGELGLQRAFTDLVMDVSPEVEAAEISLLLKIMLNRQAFFADWNEDDAAERCRLLCADRDVRSFMGVHTYQQHEWFVKERFEYLLEQLWLVDEILRSAADGDLPLPSRGVELRNLKIAAAGAGYRLDRFLARLEGNEVAADAAEDDKVTS